MQKKRVKHGMRVTTVGSHRQSLIHIHTPRQRPACQRQLCSDKRAGNDQAGAA